MTPQCKTHKIEMKLIPAGISKKTNNPYNTFYGCPNRECKETAKAPKQPVKQDTVQSSIQASVALNDAVNLHRNRNDLTIQELRKEVKETANEFVKWLKEQVEPF